MKPQQPPVSKRAGPNRVAGTPRPIAAPRTRASEALEAHVEPCASCQEALEQLDGITTVPTDHHSDDADGTARPLAHKFSPAATLEERGGPEPEGLDPDELIAIDPKCAHEHAVADLLQLAQRAPLMKPSTLSD
jgi:hypothetical protein